MNNYGLVRVGAAVPKTHVACPMDNIFEMIALARDAAEKQVKILVFPELGITGYTCGDLFNDLHLQSSALEALEEFVVGTENMDVISMVGLPLGVDNQLFNVAAVCHRGKILAIVPKYHIPNYKEFYEGRWFAPANHLKSKTISILNFHDIPIGTDILISVANNPNLKIGVEICEDLWMPIPQSSYHALAGVTVLVNLSASNIVVAKADYRRELVKNNSARNLAAYVYTSCGVHESTGDVVFDGHAMIAENGHLLLENKRFDRNPSLIFADIDVERLVRERMMTSSYGQAVAQKTKEYRTVEVRLEETNYEQIELARYVEKHPFVPSNPATRDARCNEVFDIQCAGLARRLEHLETMTGSHNVVLGVSGGLDSTLALLVAVRVFDMLGWNRKGILAITMPGFGTSDRTYRNAVALIKALGVTFREISIRDAVSRHLVDIGHSEDGLPHKNCVICENAQARERTQILMDLGFVLGTGDLSETALGWCTYNGDQMSMYNVNAGVPKTLVKYVVAWVAEKGELGAGVSTILRDIVDTPISPELEPTDGTEITQKTEDKIGPYELHDFFLFHLLRNGFCPKKIFFLASIAFKDDHSKETIIKWLKVFYKRFFAAQFKRNAAPDGPKVGSVALSQRGDWRMPSDAVASTWLFFIDTIEI